jgi:hypothetical protein
LSLQEADTVEPVVEAAPAALAPLSKVQILDFDDDLKPKDTVVAHGSIVSLAGGTLHCRLIEEGMASVMITAIEPGSEALYLYEPNMNDDPVVDLLGQAVNTITKWPISALKAA